MDIHTLVISEFQDPFKNGPSGKIYSLLFSPIEDFYFNFLKKNSNKRAYMDIVFVCLLLFLANNYILV